MELDIQYFESKLSSIDGFNNVGRSLSELVRSKAVEPEQKEPESNGTEPLEKSQEAEEQPEQVDTTAPAETGEPKTSDT